MWVGVVWSLLAWVPALCGDTDSTYQEYEAETNNDNVDFKYNYHDGLSSDAARIKTYGGSEDRRSLSTKEIISVEGNLSNSLQKNLLKTPEGQRSNGEFTDMYYYIDKSNTSDPMTGNFNESDIRKRTPKVIVSHWKPTAAGNNWDPRYDYPQLVAKGGSRFNVKGSHNEALYWDPTENLKENVDFLDETSTNIDIHAVVQKLISGDKEAIPTKPSSDQYWSYRDNIEDWITTSDTPQTMVEETPTNVDIQSEVRKIISGDDKEALPTRSTDNAQPSSPGEQDWITTGDTTKTLEYEHETSTYNNEDIQAEVQKLMPLRESTSYDVTSVIGLGSTVPDLTSVIGLGSTVPDLTSVIGLLSPIPDMTTVKGFLSPVAMDERSRQADSFEIPTKTASTEKRGEASETILNDAGDIITVVYKPSDHRDGQLRQHDVDTPTSGQDSAGNDDESTSTTTVAPTTTVSTCSTRKSPHMDINAIIAIIANLTYDYEWNLTEEFNKTLIDHGVPTCPTASTLSTTPTTPSPYDFANTSIVGKCFVCGLKTTEIPFDAYCADAFAGDFLPLVPVDPRARGQIATYRKYCRHLDVHNYVENPSEPRSIYGRFTGGCGVRWTDLTGIYTQRTCRARFRPLMGKHFASKRMAKLELALVNVENGCIISPMATLLPLSRGVSLYARFHACVCTGSWCNAAPRLTGALYTHYILQTFVLVLYCFCFVL